MNESTDSVPTPLKNSPFFTFLYPMEIFERPQVLTQQPLRVLRQSPPSENLISRGGGWGMGAWDIKWNGSYCFQENYLINHVSFII